MRGNSHAGFGKGLTEKGLVVPRRLPTSLGKGPTEKDSTREPRRWPTSLLEEGSAATPPPYPTGPPHREGMEQPYTSQYPAALVASES